MSDPDFDLEVKVAFLEHHLANVDAIVRQLADQVARLEREIGELRAERADASVRGTHQDELPPHHVRW